MQPKDKKLISTIEWHSVEKGLPKSYQEELKNENYDFPAYMLWCKNRNGMEYMPMSTFILDAKMENSEFIPAKWNGYNSGENYCEKALEDVLYWAKMPKVDEVKEEHV